MAKRGRPKGSTAKAMAMKKTEADATNQKMASQLANMLFITPGVHGPQNHSLPHNSHIARAESAS